MSNTLATRKQSEAIRARMSQIRSDLPYDVDDARQQVRRWTDWRYQFGKHPAAIMTAAAVVGYLVVPQVRREREIIVRTEHGERRQELAPAKKGLVGGVVAAAATMALKSGTSMLAQHLSQTFLNPASISKTSNQSSSEYAGAENPINSQVI